MREQRSSEITFALFRKRKCHQVVKRITKDVIPSMIIINRLMVHSKSGMNLLTLLFLPDLDCRRFVQKSSMIPIYVTLFFRYCLMKSFWWKKMKLWWSFQVPTVVQQLDLLTPTSQPLPRPEKIQLGCNWMYQICNIFILSILSIKSFEEAKIEQQWYMIWHHY